jgi:hypothetical protein
VIVLGIAATIGLIVLDVTAQNHANLVQVNNQLVTNLDDFASTAKDCQSISCLEQADGVLSQQLGSFVSDLQNSDTGGVSQGTINQMIAAAQDTRQVTAALSEAGSSVSGYQALAKKLGAEQSFARLASAQETFVNAVNGGRF